MTTTKICTKCKKKKSVSEFYTSKQAKDGHKSWCKSCDIKCAAEWAKMNKDKRSKQRKIYSKTIKDYHKKYALRKYGISLAEFEEMEIKQNGACAICGKKEVHKNQWGNVRLSVDHCHISGKVRGLLCKNCNTGLGGFKDNIENLSKAISYLIRNKGD